MFDSADGTREAMSKVDTAWLRMERPTNLMMITGVLMFAAPLVHAEIKQLLGERFLAYRRFRQRAVNTPSGAYWETDADFDLDWHVRVAALPGAADKIELENFVGELASTPLDHSKPLWQFHVVENYRGGSVLVARIHHCYADGLALVQVMLSLTDTAPEPEKRAELAATWLHRDGTNVWQRMLEPAQAGLGKALKVGNKVYGKMTEMINDPAVAADIAREGGEITRELAHALLLPDDPQTPLKGPLGVSKRVAWADPLPLEEVKTLGRALGCTVNDVLLACASGALRGYLLDQGGEVDGLTIRATVPVNLRPLEHAKKLGNHFGLVFLELPVGEANPLRRLERVAASMRELKRSRQAIVTLGLLAALGMGPQALQAPALELFSRKATAVATNVPGPQQPLYMTGVQATELMFWVPQSGSIGLGLSILSYNGRVHFGLIGDAKRVRDPSAVTQRFAAEFEKLMLIALMEDWDERIAAGDAASTLQRYL
ncbi:MAG: wax ester/triacylglycerol synthase family O-acyltransferase [Dokdonella sp.]|uniref:WS/DGAT/MGAT family O-acyltransferase n=1 Tax=Dokdonella sp. TaxID=2291710 RepID=UPI002C83A8D3|nr:wax ester/triacylglycerol synthase family O-acyltransferase [Xanthomonadales bacterium]HQV72793.1 wax ester/triacylglycerol synthase family O-acyltransferase [Dokdonella sp.]MBK7209385.1 wax ester/triacylglycerol synthase family O-acyltransferase [Xanthomonadales bacterium]MBL0223403.1 wax ester/triacylglycerol synthase family O-acyltransferase [Xanthomonadales bacterium]HQW75483.1 wax ester/triacylglycerol synthase family O-acyltransferase [Dokdonella sp.]